MIETEQAVAIAAPIDTVWRFARDIGGWASLMPGMQDCEIIDADNSRWTLKVGVGGLVRTVRVKVHVEQWDGPHTVRFAYALEGDPVHGRGTYHAEPAGAAATAVTLKVQVEGSGPMAPMWEAMGRPLLPKLAAGFAGELRDRIEADLGADAPPPAAAPAEQTSIRPTVAARLAAWWRSLVGRKEHA